MPPDICKTKLTLLSPEILYLLLAFALQQAEVSNMSLYQFFPTVIDDRL